MTRNTRQLIALLPLGLILSGCAGPERVDTASDRASGKPARASGHEVALVANRSVDSWDRLPDRPAKSDLQHDITVGQIVEHVRNGTAVVIDARSPREFAEGHVRGALNVPAGQVDAYISQVEQLVSRDQFIILYCSGPWCGSSDMVCEQLAGYGYANMRVYSPGWMILSSVKALR